jgi:hypothetical protein
LKVDFDPAYGNAKEGRRQAGAALISLGVDRRRRAQVRTATSRSDRAVTTNHGRILFFLTAALGACQPTGSVQVGFESAAVTAAGAAAKPDSVGGDAPDVLGIKLVAVYLAEDIDGHMDNVGEVARIWTNPLCDSDLHACGIAPIAGPYQVTGFFDLARSSEAVNAELNAAPEPVKAGTYRYVRVDFAGIVPTGDDTPNLRFGRDGDVREIRFRDNNVTVAIDPPLTVEEGGSFVVLLSYDASHAFFSGPDLRAGGPPAGVSIDDWYCIEDPQGGSGPPCLAFRGFVPKVVTVSARSDGGR